MVSQVISFRRRHEPKGDWTKDELAELYRVESALVQARIALEVDRGMTDEGDPWFVFCHTDGSVLVHIARSDGNYHLFSPALPQGLSGPSFADLTKKFAASSMPAGLSQQDKAGATIILHPAARLSILVGTVFFFLSEMSGHRATAAELSLPDAAAQGGDQVGTTALSEPRSSSLVEWLKIIGQKGSGAPGMAAGSKHDAATSNFTSYHNLMQVVALGAIWDSGMTLDFLATPAFAAASDGYEREENPFHLDDESNNNSAFTSPVTSSEAFLTSDPILHTNRPNELPQDQLVVAWDDAQLGNVKFPSMAQSILLKQPFTQEKSAAHTDTTAQIATEATATIASGHSDEAYVAIKEAPVLATPSDPGTKIVSIEASNKASEPPTLSEGKGQASSLGDIKSDSPVSQSGFFYSGKLSAEVVGNEAIVVVERGFYDAAAHHEFYEYLTQAVRLGMYVAENELIVFDQSGENEPEGQLIRLTWETDSDSTVSIVGYADHLTEFIV